MAGKCCSFTRSHCEKVNQAFYINIGRMKNQYITVSVPMKMFDLGDKPSGLTELPFMLSLSLVSNSSYITHMK